MLCSLSLSYNVITCAWDNLLEYKQTMHTQTLQLLKHEYMIKMQNENQTYEWDMHFFHQVAQVETNNMKVTFERK